MKATHGRWRLQNYLMGAELHQGKRRLCSLLQKIIPRRALGKSNGDRLYRTKECFAAFHIPIGIDFSYGGTEAHILRDYLYGVCLSDTGASIAANGLKIIHTLLETHTSLIVSREIWLISSELEVPENPKQEMVKALVHLLLGVLDAREQVFLVMNVSVGKKGGLLQQLPALKTPTVTPLANSDYFSVGAVVRKDGLSTLIPSLLLNGAEDLIEMPISKVIRSWQATKRAK